MFTSLLTRNIRNKWFTLCTHDTASRKAHCAALRVPHNIVSNFCLHKQMVRTMEACVCVCVCIGVCTCVGSCVPELTQVCVCNFVYHTRSSLPFTHVSYIQSPHKHVATTSNIVIAPLSYLFPLQVTT